MIVQAGKQFTAADLKDTAGRLAAFLRDTVQDGSDFAVQLQTWTDPDLIELGLAQPEIDAIKGFFVGDLPAIRDLVATSTWIKQLLGTGV
jgi:hypothetical protein